LRFRLSLPEFVSDSVRFKQRWVSLLMESCTLSLLVRRRIPSKGSSCCGFENGPRSFRQGRVFECKSSDHYERPLFALTWRRREDRLPESSSANSARAYMIPTWKLYPHTSLHLECVISFPQDHCNNLLEIQRPIKFVQPKPR
jgi:hypothetical protein